MCVIMYVDKVRPTEDMIDQAWHANDDGAGIAWREKGEVVWTKGITDKQEIKDLCATVPLPYVVHFRIASVGGIKKELTHPFLISADCPLDLKGRTKGFVMFHNGHWTQWQDKALESAIRSNVKVPSGGAWSDSRAMAWMAHIYGKGILDWIPGQRIIIVGPASIIFIGEYVKVNDVWCSNDLFLKRGFKGGFSPTRRLCPVGKCTNYVEPGETICWECKSARDVSGKLVTSGTAQGNTTAATTTGGTGASSSPFGASGYLTVAEAEAMKRRGELSGNLLKKIKRAHDIIRGAKSQKQIERARKELKLHTDVALTRLATGSQH